MLALESNTPTFAQPTPGYNNKIPAKIMTPDTVPSRLGTLEFFDGLPTDKTAAKLFDHLDFLRGVETFLDGIPATLDRSLAARYGRTGRHQSPSSRHHGRTA